MGCDMDAFYDVDQEEIQRYIDDHQIDTKDKTSVAKLTKHFYEKLSGNLLEPDTPWYYIPAMYHYDRHEEIHYISEYFYCNSIRDHELIKNREYPYYRKNLPSSISGWSSIYNPQCAIETATDIRRCFPEDETLMHFAEWLERTSKYCNRYDYSC